MKCFPHFLFILFLAVKIHPINIQSLDGLSILKVESASPKKPLSLQSEPDVSRFYIGGNYAYLYFTLKSFPVFTGNLGGAQGFYEYRSKNWLYESIKVLWKQGSISGRGGKRNIVDIDTTGRIGYLFHNHRATVALFSGFGWRYFSQEIKREGKQSLFLNYNQPYIPVGLFSDFSCCSKITIETYITWMPQIFPTVNIIPLGGARWILEYTLANFLFELPIIFDFCEPSCSAQRFAFSLMIKPFVQLWHDGKSIARTKAATIEAPPSTTTAFSVFSTSLGVPKNSYLFCGFEINLGGIF